VATPRTAAILALAAVTCLPALVPAQQPQGTTGAGTSPAAESRERNLRAYTELLRSDLRTQKVALITEVMQFTEAEDQAFWPVYREYEKELALLNDERLQGIETYAKVYDALTDESASSLIVKALDLEARRTALKQKYYGRLKTVMSPRTAARVLQIENQIGLIIDLQIASALPVAQ
jgi:hypothetical protein